MIIKKEIKESLDQYDKNRSCFKISFFLYAIDYIHPDTKFYYELRNFYNQNLAKLDSESALSQQNIDTLTKLVKRHEMRPNSTNDAIVDLYDAVTALINRETDASRPPSRFIFDGK